MSGEIQSAKAEAGANTPASELERKHDDQDILKGCPREVSICGIPVTQKAFKNSEYSNFMQAVVMLGFNALDTEEEIEAATAAQIFTGCCLDYPFTNGALGCDSFEEYVFSRVQFPESNQTIDFYAMEVPTQELMDFFAVLLEQNNIIPVVKRYAKKNLKIKMAALSQKAPATA